MTHFHRLFFHYYSVPARKYSLLFFVLLLALGSCKLTKQSTYFSTITKDTTITGFIPNDFESTIRKGDQLSITVTSLSAVEDEQFNKAAAPSASPGMSGFTVYPDGAVLLHRLGRVKVEGLTRRELAAKLEKELLPYLKDPIVNVNYLNHKVTVIGEVGGPQVLPMPEEQMNILDVLVKSGGVTANGIKSDVMIIREEGTQKQVKHVNLEDPAIFTSPWYYIKPNDIIYVKSNFEQQEKAEKKQQLQYTLSLIATGMTFLFVVIDRIFR